MRKLRGPRRSEAAGIIVTAPGEEAQVDYGSGPMVRDPQSGKYRRTRLAMLDRLLHHGHILKCGPRSWRTKTDLPDQEKAG